VVAAAVVATATTASAASVVVTVVLVDCDERERVAAPDLDRELDPLPGARSDGGFVPAGTVIVSGRPSSDTTKGESETIVPSIRAVLACPTWTGCPSSKASSSSKRIRNRATSPLCKPP
jgi:hypothetical protein